MLLLNSIFMHFFSEGWLSLLLDLLLSVRQKVVFFFFWFSFYAFFWWKNPIREWYLCIWALKCACPLLSIVLNLIKKKTRNESLQSRLGVVSFGFSVSSCIYFHFYCLTTQNTFFLPLSVLWLFRNKDIYRECERMKWTSWENLLSLPFSIHFDVENLFNEKYLWSYDGCESHNFMLFNKLIVLLAQKHTLSHSFNPFTI